jgi:hypothetical protein
MDHGRCRRCGRPFEAGELVGLGVLRARPEAKGGPYLEFQCPECRLVLRLIPHGEGRYAYPGEAPPPAPPEADRRPPWQRDRKEPPPEPMPRVAPVPPAATASRAAEAPPRPPPPAPNKGRTEARASDGPMTVARALAILGVSAGADEAAIDRAYRERALRTHPDKAAHLDEEIQALAERRFKELQEARRLLLGE